MDFANNQRNLYMADLPAANRPFGTGTAEELGFDFC